MLVCTSKGIAFSKILGGNYLYKLEFYKGGPRFIVLKRTPRGHQSHSINEESCREARGKPVNRRENRNSTSLVRGL